MNCTVEGCDRTACAVGLCSMHYGRRYRTGDAGEAAPRYRWGKSPRDVDVLVRLIDAGGDLGRRSLFTVDQKVVDPLTGKEHNAFTMLHTFRKLYKADELTEYETERLTSAGGLKSRNRKYTSERVTDLVVSVIGQGSTWQGSDVKAQTALTVVCPRGHTFQTTPNRLDMGHGCALCVQENFNVSGADLKKVCAAQGWSLADDINDNVLVLRHVKFNLVCSNNHTVSKSWRDLGTKSGCRKCYVDGLQEYLPPEVVVEIYTSRMSGTSIAAKFNLSRQYVSRIRNGHVYRELTNDLKKGRSV